MRDIGAQSPENRDYAAAIDRMVEFCRKYTASTSARAVRRNAEIWFEEKLISRSEVDRVRRVFDEADPAAEEMKEIKPRLEAAFASTDIEALKSIAERLEAIRQEYPGTQSCYDAMSALPSIYARVGDHARARQATDRFLDAYPAESTDQNGNEHRQFMLELQGAIRTANWESLEQGLEDLAGMQSRYGDKAEFGMRIVANAISLALNGNRTDDVIDMGEEALEQYSQLRDSDRYIVVKAKVGEAYIRKKEYEKARKIYHEIQSQYPGSVRSDSAQVMLDQIDELVAIDRGEHRIPVSQVLGPPLEPTSDLASEASTEIASGSGAKVILSGLRGALLLVLLGWCAYRKCFGSK